MNPNPSVNRTRRKRIHETQIVEVQIGVQTKRYEPVQYNPPKNGDKFGLAFLDQLKNPRE
jgi:hypothetical protein